MSNPHSLIGGRLLGEGLPHGLFATGSCRNDPVSGLVDLTLDHNSGEVDSLPWVSWMSRNSHITSCASVSPVAEMAAMTFLLMWHFKTPEERLGVTVVLCL